MLKKLYLLFSTVKYLKLIQIRYQIIYSLKKARSLKGYNRHYNPEQICSLSFTRTPPVFKSLLFENSFLFLNQQVDFGDEINWNYQENGKLWNYNLQYANYLLQEDITIEKRKKILISLYTWLLSNKLPLEPYPISLRAINIIRFLSANSIKDTFVLENLHAELDFLSQNPEFHLLGNHLLENAFALFAGGVFFNNKHWIIQGQKILHDQLDEQILKDGGHFELSPMYHQIILFRLLECIDWYTKFKGKDKTFELYLKNKASIMLTWLENISFNDGSVPHFNDSADGIAYSTNWLRTYAKDLEINTRENLKLKESGYRVFKRSLYMCAVDVGQIGPSYQPGHGHADTLSFILSYRGKPLFVEWGTSTYEENKRRENERSSRAHNTVVINNQNQSEVYKSFRVANRAKTKILFEDETQLLATHNGYLKSLGTLHKRSFTFGEQFIEIIDDIDKTVKGKAYFHFHSNINIIVNKEKCIIEGIGQILFEGAEVIEKASYEMSNGFNNTRNASLISVEFTGKLKTYIDLINY